MELNSSATRTVKKKKPVRSYYQTFKNVCANITVEPLLICFVLPYDMANLTVQNFYLEKACRVNLNLSETICDALSNRDSHGYNETHEIAVQKLVSQVNIWKDLLQSVFPLILLPFLGPWSDRNCCRKKCIIFPMMGELFSRVGLLFCTYFFYQLPLEVNAVLEALPMAFTAGNQAVYMGVFSFIEAISTEQNRTLRVGIVYVVFWGCTALGSALSGILYQIWGFYGVFSLATCIYLVGIMYGIFMVKEDKSDMQENKVGFFKDFFDFDHVKSVLNMLFSGDTKTKIMKVWFITILTLLINGPMSGNMEVVYLYSRFKFKWDEVDYSIFVTVTCVAHLLGNAFALGFFSKLMKCDDALLGVIASSSRLFGLLVYPFAPTSEWFYSGILAEVFVVTNLVAVRGISSKLVPTNELGKMNSLIAIFDALAPLSFGPLYNAVYKSSVETFPGMFYILGAAFTVPVILMFLSMYVEAILKRRKVEKSSNIGTLPTQRRLPTSETINTDL